MATSSNSAKNATAGFPWKRLLFLLGALVVFRIGAHIPVPGIDSEQLALLFRQNQGGILGMFNMFSGVYGFCTGHHAVYFSFHYHANARNCVSTNRCIEKGR